MERQMSGFSSRLLMYHRFKYEPGCRTSARTQHGCLHVCFCHSTVSCTALMGSKHRCLKGTMSRSVTSIPV